MLCVLRCSRYAQHTQQANFQRPLSEPKRPGTRSLGLRELPFVDDNLSSTRVSMSHRRNQPAEKGWNYQGTNEQSRVDFWEKDGTKLDYYYTTGTSKTSMHHPGQGKNTQMFRRDLSDAAHGNVLDNPRYHSGAGYQTRQNMPANRSSSSYNGAGYSSQNSSSHYQSQGSSGYYGSGSGSYQNPDGYNQGYDQGYY